MIIHHLRLPWPILLFCLYSVPAVHEYNNYQDATEVFQNPSQEFTTDLVIKWTSSERSPSLKPHLQCHSQTDSFLSSAVPNSMTFTSLVFSISRPTCPDSPTTSTTSSAEEATRSMVSTTISSTSLSQTKASSTALPSASSSESSSSTTTYGSSTSLAAASTPTTNTKTPADSRIVTTTERIDSTSGEMASDWSTSSEMKTTSSTGTPELTPASLPTSTSATSIAKTTPGATTEAATTEATKTSSSSTTAKTIPGDSTEPATTESTPASPPSSTSKKTWTSSTTTMKRTPGAKTEPAATESTAATLGATSRTKTTSSHTLPTSTTASPRSTSVKQTSSTTVTKSTSAATSTSSSSRTSFPTTSSIPASSSPDVPPTSSSSPRPTVHSSSSSSTTPRATPVSTTGSSSHTSSQTKRSTSSSATKESASSSGSSSQAKTSTSSTNTAAVSTTGTSSQTSSQTRKSTTSISTQRNGSGTGSTASPTGKSSTDSRRKTSVSRSTGSSSWTKTPSSISTRKTTRSAESSPSATSEKSEASTRKTPDSSTSEMKTTSSKPESTPGSSKTVSSSQATRTTAAPPSSTEKKTSTSSTTTMKMTSAAKTETTTKSAPTTSGASSPTKTTSSNTSPTSTTASSTSDGSTSPSETASTTSISPSSTSVKQSSPTTVTKATSASKSSSSSSRTSAPTTSSMSTSSSPGVPSTSSPSPPSETYSRASSSTTPAAPTQPQSSSETTTTRWETVPASSVSPTQTTTIVQPQKSSEAITTRSETVPASSVSPTQMTTIVQPLKSSDTTTTHSQSETVPAPSVTSAQPKTSDQPLTSSKTTPIQSETVRASSDSPSQTTTAEKTTVDTTTTVAPTTSKTPKSSTIKYHAYTNKRGRGTEIVKSAGSEPTTVSQYSHMMTATTTEFRDSYTIENLPEAESCPDEECPDGYIIGETTCIYPVPFHFGMSYHKAFSFCIGHPHSTMMSEVDLKANRHSLIKWAKETNETLMDTYTYLFTNPHPHTIKGRQYVEVMTLGNLTLSHLDKTMIHYLAKQEQRTMAFCKRPKFCQSLGCPLDMIYDKFYGELPLPMIGEEIPYRKTIQLPCLPPSSTILKITCFPFSISKPYLENLKCEYPEGLEPELMGNPLRAECDECYPMGTESCHFESGGYRCVCKPGWYKYTCWKHLELCKGREDRGLCNGRGDCLSLIDDFSCRCDAFYYGKSCQLDARKTSLFGDDTHMAIISSSTVASFILFAGSVVIWISINVARGFLGQSFTSDPQTLYILIRNVNTFFASLVSTFFSRPVLMNFNPVLCRLAYNINYSCTFYALALLVSEQWNLFLVYGGHASNTWYCNAFGEQDKKLKPEYGVGWGLVILPAVLFLGNWYLWDTITMTSTCLGPVDLQDSIYLWSVGILFGLLYFVIYYANRAYTERSKSEELMISMLHFTETKAPQKMGRLERLTRNKNFPLALATLLFLHYLFNQMALDWVGYRYLWMDGLVIVLAVCYTVLNLIQFVVVHDEILEYIMTKWAPTFPYFPWPTLTPVNYLNIDEIEALRTGNPVKNQAPCWDGWRFHPSYDEYISEENRTHFLRKISGKYIEHRTTGDMKPVEAIQAIMEEHTILLHKTTPMAEQLRELTTKWMLEINAWDVHNLRLWHCPCTTEEEEARQFIDHPFMPAGEIEIELDIVERMKRIKKAINHNSVRVLEAINVLRGFEKSAIDMFGKLELFWKPEKPKVAPGRLRRQLQVLEKIYKTTREEADLQFCLDNPESTFAQDYLFSDLRPTFIGPRKRGSTFEFPFMKDYICLRWYDEFLHEREWEELRFNHYACLRMKDGWRNPKYFDRHVNWLKRYEECKKIYDREELVWRLQGKTEPHEQGKTYRQLKAERPKFEDRFPEYANKPAETSSLDIQLMKLYGTLPLPPSRPTNIYLEELPREYEPVPDHGFQDDDHPYEL